MPKSGFISSRLSRFTNLRIRAQIRSVSVVILAGFIVLAVAAAINLFRFESLQNQATHLEQIKRSANSLQTLFLEARRREKDFLLRLDDKYAKDHDGIVARADGEFGKLGRLEADPKVLSSISAVSQAFMDYAAGFRDVVKMWHEMGLDENKGLMGALRTAVHSIEAELNKYDAPRVMVQMLMLRRHEKDFFLRLDAKYARQLDEAATAFRRALAASALTAPQKADILKLLDTYHRDVKAVIEMRLKTEAKYQGSEREIRRGRAQARRHRRLRRHPRQGGTFPCQFGPVLDHRHYRRCAARHRGERAVDQRHCRPDRLGRHGPRDRGDEDARQRRYHARDSLPGTR